MIFNKIIFRRYIIVLAGSAVAVLASCNQQADIPSDQPAEVISPVEVTGITHAPLTDYIELTAVSSYQQKSYVKANMNGYVQSVNAIVGQQVGAGTLLFRLITKEAQAIGNAVNKLEPGLKFSGVSAIRSNQSGFITTISHQKGDYAQDGELLAVISNQNSFVFLMNLPYELHRLISSRETIELTLPDGEKLDGIIDGFLSAVDSLSQTQRVIVRVNTLRAIPEGLIAKAKIRRTSSSNAQVLPKSAVLTNETEDEFWVMKLIDDSTAVKVPVKKGIENDEVIEILSPVFNVKDRIISIGNYGIADTAKVKVVKSL